MPLTLIIDHFSRIVSTTIVRPFLHFPKLNAKTKQISDFKELIGYAIFTQ